MMMVQLLFVLSVLGSYVVVMSDPVNLTATIPPGYALQDYLCSGPLESNTTLVLGDGEHRISSGPPCNISNGGNIAITGSAMNNTTIHCEGEGRVFVFISAQTLSAERITFINCGIRFISIENILITECTFQNSSNTAIYSHSLNHTSITIADCLFVDNNGDDGGAVFLELLTGDVRISNCTFQNNSARYGGGGVRFYGSTGNVSITNCTFQYNSATYNGGGGVLLDLSTGDVSITNCTFQNNSVLYGGGDGGGGGVSLYLSTGDVSITNCTFQSNRATNGGGVSFSDSNGHVNITNCTFQNNSASYGGGDGGGGGVSLYLSTGDVSITNCTFQSNRATNGGGVSFSDSNGHVNITNCTFQNNSASYGGGDGGGGGVSLYLSTGDVSITNCTFQSNRATNGGGVSFSDSNGHVNITNCTFQNNSASYGGGGVSFSYSTGNVSITNTTFQNNSASFGGGMSFFISIGTCNVIITNCIFQSNSATMSLGGGGVLLYRYKGKVSITNCGFQGNSAINIGGGVSVQVSTSDVTIKNCTFQKNSVIASQDAGNGGSVIVYALKGDVSITDCTFQNSSVSDGDNSAGGVVMLYGIKGNSNISNCTFQNNRALYGGAVSWVGIQGDIRIGSLSLVLQGSAGNLCITNCTFQNNSATKGGGAVFSWVGVLSNILNSNADVELNGSAGDVNITNCTFHNNRATYGGGIFFVSIRSTLISGSTFTNNTAVGGAAVYAVNSYIPSFFAVSNFLTSDTAPFGYLLLQDVIVKDNYCSCNDYNELRGGAIYFNGMKVDIFGNTFTESQFSSNSPLGAIQGTNGFLKLHGIVTFTNNTGVNGGAISLSNNVPLYFYEGCAVEFSKNTATGFGGAIYNAGDQANLMQPTSNLNKCTIRFIKDCYSSNCEFNTNMFSVTFIDNHAQQGGHSVYATPIYNCTKCIGVLATGNLVTQSGKCPNLSSYFNTTPLPEDINDIQLLSFPKYVHLCDSKDTNMYNVTNQFQGKVTTYPGRTVRLNVTSVDEGRSLSPSVIYTQIDTNGITSSKITLGPTQKAQWIGPVCGTVEYQIYGPEMASLKLLLSNYPSNTPTVVEITLLPCEPGFTLISNLSTGVIECSCSEFFTSSRVVCDASDGTVTRNKTNWIGVYNSTLPALASYCPMDYCNSAIDKLSLAQPDVLCNGGRTGIICGSCHDNHSVIFGSSQCKMCSNMWLMSLVMFAVLGALLVAALFLLNLTVTQGTLYGLIFYANIIQVNSSILFRQSILSSLQVIMSFVNLDLGIPMCFYDGMDDADKAGLQFVFPAYLLILTLIVIVTCHYCLQRSPTTSTCCCLYRFPIIIGERAVGVLCTLIYLSYSKLLRTVIDIFTYSTVHLSSGDMYVWFYDGNVEYLHKKHAVLFVIAVLTCTLFLLPYTFALTFIPIIERYSEHNRLFNYLHKLANKFKPVNDAYYAPYKGEWRWWLGARLWLVVVMYILNPVYSSDNPSLLLSIQATLVILFMLVQASIQPFGQSLQKTYNCNRHTSFYNKLYNCLDLTYLLNYTALAVSMSYILGKSSNETQITVLVLVGLYVVMLLVTVLYHFIVAILKACNSYDRAKEKINELFERKDKEMAPIELDEHAANTDSETVNYGLWE
eukprot:Em0004g1538a